MRLAIFGGTGRTGKHVVQQALDAGHTVVVLARTPAKLDITHDNLTVVAGDILDYGSVEQVVQGADAVISALGPSSNKSVYTVSKGTDNVLKAMQAHDVGRIIVTAGAGVRDPQDKPGLIDHIFGVLLKLVNKNVLADMESVVEKVRTSDRDWTVVRAPMLTDEAPQGVDAGYLGNGVGVRLSRADMAAFMLAQLESDTWVNQAPVISSKRAA